MTFDVRLRSGLVEVSMSDVNSIHKQKSDMVRSTVSNQ